MAEYIEREKAIEAFDDPAVERYYGDVCPESVIRVIEQIPAADVRPVVRGKWKIISFMTVQCSNCRYTFHELEGDNFYPNCGADMMEES